LTPATAGTGRWTPGAGVRGAGGARVENARVATVQQGESTFGPVAVDGRTITLVARTRAVRLGRRGAGALGLRARPTHVEVLEADGRRQVVRIRDIESGAIITIALATVGYVLGVRALRRRESA
jgi:hypothetical protein